LLSHEINLVAYHLPLDAHPELGNNAQLALKLDMQVEQRFDLGGAIGIGYQGQLKTAMDADQFASHLERKLGRKPVYVKGNDKKILSIAWCSGGAQSYFDEVISRGVDAYLTGEASEYNFHSAMENQVNFFSAGHHATERYGVQALAELLVKKFDLTYSFFDQENPI
ncbi:MAG: Nif3-like dinuclear metal center hexameric protein, partial [Gammaproteobacteria bacterium]|nr:Nif3-like dinuclear metal center hexameric protein [Gammaproteobacteria bacterium]